MYSITNRQSYIFLTYDDNNVHDNIKILNGQTMKILLIGNNCENEKNRQVTTEEAQKFASSHNFLFFETSTITSHNIQESIIELTKQILKLPTFINKKIYKNDKKIVLNKKQETRKNIKSKCKA